MYECIKPKKCYTWKSQLGETEMLYNREKVSRITIPFLLRFAVYGVECNKTFAFVLKHSAVLLHSSSHIYVGMYIIYLLQVFIQNKNFRIYTFPHPCIVYTFAACMFMNPILNLNVCNEYIHRREYIYIEILRFNVGHDIVLL